MENYSNVDYYGEFHKYATKHLGVSGMQMMAWEQTQNRIYGPSASLTPYILEERDMRSVTQMDIFSRLMMDRILWVAGVVNDMMSTVVQAQLMFLDNLDSSDITMHIDTPGGSVKSGLSMIDVMEYITSDIVTINTGMSASMGSVLLGAGTKGKRLTLPSSKVMLHQVSAGAEGTVQDMRISMGETEKYNDILFDKLGSYCGKTAKQIKKDADRDLWLDADKSIKYGLVDEIVRNKK